MSDDKITHRYSVTYKIPDDLEDSDVSTEYVDCDEIIYECSFVRFRNDGRDYWVLSADALIEIEYMSSEVK